MDADELRDEEAEQAQHEADAVALAAAQRLAACDPDVREALDHAWWTGLRQGLDVSLDRPVSLPSSPFSSAAIERLYPWRSGF